MAENTDDKTERVYIVENFEGTQIGTSRFLKKLGDLNLAQNAHFDEAGSVGRKLGYAIRESVLTTTSTSSSTTTSTTTTQ